MKESEIVKRVKHEVARASNFIPLSSSSRSDLSSSRSDLSSRRSDLKWSSMEIYFQFQDSDCIQSNNRELEIRHSKNGKQKCGQSKKGAKLGIVRRPAKRRPIKNHVQSVQQGQESGINGIIRCQKIRSTIDTSVDSSDLHCCKSHESGH